MEDDKYLNALRHLLIAADAANTCKQKALMEYSLRMMRHSLNRRYPLNLNSLN